MIFVWIYLALAAAVGAIVFAMGEDEPFVSRALASLLVGLLHPVLGGLIIMLAIGEALRRRRP